MGESAEVSDDRAAPFEHGVEISLYVWSTGKRVTSLVPVVLLSDPPALSSFMLRKYEEIKRERGAST